MTQCYKQIFKTTEFPNSVYKLKIENTMTSSVIKQ